MGTLVYSVICSLDGYLADENGDFSWAFPDEQIHRHANREMSGVSLQLLGRRMYQMMEPWETDPSLADSPVGAEFARCWQDSDKIVYSSTLTEPLTARTSLRRAFDAEEVRRLVREAPGDVAISGPTLAAAAFGAGLVDEVRMVVMQVTVGGGLPVFPPGQRIPLALTGSAAFDGGALGLTYRVVSTPSGLSSPA